MSIRENVWFNQKFDCFEGYEDLGSQGKTCNIANRALLFMVLGLNRKWKQPVAYYPSRGSTKAEMLKQFLEEVLEACQKIGLHVVATVCDMGTNNDKAMKLKGNKEWNNEKKFSASRRTTVVGMRNARVRRCSARSGKQRRSK